jgi:peptidoglycan/LPS O-acetylase OafA/YrhL
MHIKTLDGIRGVAVLAVLFFHYGDLSQSHSALLRFLGFVKGAGWIGVDLFFVLSGFLITGILLDTQGDPRKAQNFYARRALRLFPLFYGVWIGIGIYMLVSRIPWDAAYSFYLLYAGNFVAIKHGTIGVLRVSPLWSLAVEEQYYLLWPLVIWKLRGAERIKPILLGCLIVPAILKVILLLFHTDPYVPYYMLPTHVEPLAMGSYLAIAMRTDLAPKLTAWSRSLLPLSIIAFACIGAIEKTMTFLDPVVRFAFPLFGLFGCCLILRSFVKGTLTNRLMSNPILVFYGKYSYGLYIFSTLFHDALKVYLYPAMATVLHNQVLLGVAYMLAAYFALTIISVASFHLYENQFLKLKRKFTSRRRSTLSPTMIVDPVGR